MSDATNDKIEQDVDKKAFIRRDSGGLRRRSMTIRRGRFWITTVHHDKQRHANNGMNGSPGRLSRTFLAMNANAENHK